METWTSLSTPSVQDTYAEQPPPHAQLLGSLFEEALASYASARHPQPVMAPPTIVHLVPAESSSIFSMLRGYLRGRAPRA